MTKELRPIALLPWLDLPKEIRVGRVVFWPYAKMKDSNLPERYPVGQMDKYTNIFRTPNDKLAPVTCLSYLADPDKQLTARQVAEIINARYALFAAAYVAGLCDPYLEDLYSGLPSADHFAIRPLPERKGLEKSIWGFRYPRTSLVGVIGEGWSEKPPQHLHRYGCQIFDPLLKTLTIALTRSRHPNIPYVRRALEWFFYAQTTQEHFTEEARHVLLCMAIEAAMCEVFTQAKFREEVRNAVVDLKLPRRWRCVYNDKGRKEKVLWNILEIWAWDFYGLRTHLVHAKAERRTSVVWSGMRPKAMHHFIAPYVWFECLWHTLRRSGVVPPQPADAGDVLANTLTYGKWYWTWEEPICRMREWWKGFLTGKIPGSDYGTLRL